MCVLWIYKNEIRIFLGGFLYSTLRIYFKILVNFTRSSNIIISMQYCSNLSLSEHAVCQRHNIIIVAYLVLLSVFPRVSAISQLGLNKVHVFIYLSKTTAFIL